MAIQWPASLPQKVQRSNFQQREESGVIRQEMKIGPVNVRKRTDSGYRPMQAEIHCTKDQLQDFIFFVEITLRQQSLPFNWKDPVFGNTTTFRFVTPPSWVPYGHRFKVSLDLEMRVLGGS